jgi:membrane protein implicated in regulation of membrane protease activity
MALLKVLQWLQFAPSGSSELTSASASIPAFLQGLGIVEDPIRINKVGRIRLHGVYWFARSTSDRIIAVDEEVKVVALNGNTLTVEPICDPHQMVLALPGFKLRDCTDINPSCPAPFDIFVRQGS